MYCPGVIAARSLLDNAGCLSPAVSEAAGDILKLTVIIMQLYIGQDRGIFVPPVKALRARQPGEDDFISFCLSHGAYLVETNLGSLINGGGDQTLVYRCSAAAAEYSRRLAMDYYKAGRPYGYVTGGRDGYRRGAG